MRPVGLFGHGMGIALLSLMRTERHAGEQRIIIVGNGMVGWELCRRLVAQEDRIAQRITVFGEETRPAYDRIRLAECLGGADPVRLTLAQEAWYQEHGIDLILGTPVIALDPAQRRVQAGGRWLGADAIVLATGSRPWLPPIPGADLPGVRTFRTVDDACAIAATCTPGCRVAVIGGGLLGLELSKALADLAAVVTVLERSPGLMVRQLNPVASEILREQVEGLGIRVLTEIVVQEIIAVGDIFRVRWAAGELDADVVVVAAGIRPRDELARQAGLVCSPSGGVQVDARLATSAAGVFAIGECACVGTTVYGLAAPGYAMAAALASRLAGDEQAIFHGSDQATCLKLAGLDVATHGDYLADGEVQRWRDGMAYRQVVLRENRYVGATVIGHWDEEPALADAVSRQLVGERRRLRAFTRTGSLFAGAAGVAAWPATAVVCSCRRVTRGELAAACLAGCSSVEALGAACGAGTVCGSCRPLLAVIVGSDPRAEPLPRATPAVAATSAMILLGALMVLLWSWPRAQSWEEMGMLEHLWRDETARQLSGWLVLGAFLASLALSVRKRLPRLRLGDVGWWRLVHVAAAAIGCIGLIAHNGLRTGSGQDHLMAMLILAAIACGGIAGLLIGMERLADSRAVRSARIWSVRVHLVALAMSAPILAVHVYKAYRY